MYVDDVLIAVKDREMITELKEKLHRNFASRCKVSMKTVAEEVLQTMRSVTLGSGDLKEELSHRSRHNIANPPSYNVATTRTVTHPGLQDVGGPGYVGGNLRVQTGEEDMPYPYPKYSNHPDTRSHMKQFRSIWAMNHGIQGLSAASVEKSKIVEFEMSLEGHASRSYAL